KPFGGDMRGGVDQITQDRLFSDNPGVVRNIGGGGNKIIERCQVGGPSHGFKLAAVFETFAQSNDIDGLRAVGQLDHGAENFAVRFAIEVLRSKRFQNHVDRVV